MLGKEHMAEAATATANERHHYLAGFDRAIALAASLCEDLNQPNMAILVRAIGTAQVDPETGRPLNWDDTEEEDFRQ